MTDNTEDNVKNLVLLIIGLLAAMACSKREGLMAGGSPCLIETFVLVWLIGLIVGEVQQVSFYVFDSLLSNI